VILTLAAVVAIAALSGGGDDGEQRAADRDRQQQPRDQRRREREQAPAEEPQAQQPAAPAPEEPAPTGGGTDSAEGARLNEQGFALMQQGNYDEAIPVLERAVNSFPEGTSDINYAYALYNLGRSLRLAGRPDEAIPVLERRLQIPNQTGTVRAELDAAKREAGRS
jgi:tetratricopeptide (TPR) repeat protein